MDAAWQAWVVPRFVDKLVWGQRCRDLPTDMPRYTHCHKCGRDDPECVLDLNNLNPQHWRDSCLSSGELVDGALLYCPTERHVVCVRCIRDNWWSIKARNQSMCGCIEKPWTLTWAIIANVPLHRILQLWHMPCQKITWPMSKVNPETNRRMWYRCPHSLEKVPDFLVWPDCLCCHYLAESGFIKHELCKERFIPAPLPSPLPCFTKPGLASLKSMCLWQLSTLDTQFVRRELSLDPNA